MVLTFRISTGDFLAFITNLRWFLTVGRYKIRYSQNSRVRDRRGASRALHRQILQLLGDRASLGHGSTAS